MSTIIWAAQSFIKMNHVYDCALEFHIDIDADIGILINVDIGGDREIDVARFVPRGIDVSDIRTQQIHSLSSKRQHLRRYSQCFVYCCHGLFPCQLSPMNIQKPCQLKKDNKNKHLRTKILSGKVLTLSVKETFKTTGARQPAENSSPPVRQMTLLDMTPYRPVPQYS